MLVKNEAENLKKFLPSILPHVTGAVILDTGSTDETFEVLKKLAHDHKVPITIRDGPFDNFGQARNLALSYAYSYRDEFDYILFCDADMQLVGEFPELTAPLYDMLQVNGGMSYWNTRLIRKDVRVEYVGVTHEYLSTPVPAARLLGASYVDHACGSNRSDKYDRDIRLLNAEIERNPNAGREWFYLANTYRDKGDLHAAIAAYEKRIEIGGWDEEIWASKLYLARCWKAAGNEDKFIRAALDAYTFRSLRAEPLYDLAKYYREKNQHSASVLFAEAGLEKSFPDDMLFVEHYSYCYGLKEELAICGFYMPEKKVRAAKLNNELCLSLSAPATTRNQAKFNSFWYVPRLSELAPGFKQIPLEFTPPPGWAALNPSIIHDGDGFTVNVRTVNYRITDAGHYDMQGDTAIRTRNFLVTLDDKFWPVHTCEIEWYRGLPAYDQVIGMEDVRLFKFKGDLYCSANVREQNLEGWCEQWLFRLDHEFGRVLEASHMKRPQRFTEKNWMPFIKFRSNDITFVYNIGTIVDGQGNTVKEFEVPYYVADLRGGGQVIPYYSSWLAIVHEAFARPDNGQRYYQHRFVSFDDRDNVKIGPAFVINDKQIEFAAGLCRNKTDVIISYGVKDREACLCSIPLLEVPL